MLSFLGYRTLKGINGTQDHDLISGTKYQVKIKNMHEVCVQIFNALKIFFKVIVKNYTGVYAANNVYFNTLKVIKSGL